MLLRNLHHENHTNDWVKGVPRNDRVKSRARKDR